MQWGPADSLCRKACEIDCARALMDATCPGECATCLIKARFIRDDACWLPAGKDIADFPELNRVIKIAGEE